MQVGHPYKAMRETIKIFGKMNVSLIDRVKGFFSKDKFGYWFNHFADEEKKQAAMDAIGLAKIIAADTDAESEKRKIVAEYILKQRIAKLQAKATLVAAIIGAVLGGLITGIISFLVNYY